MLYGAPKAAVGYAVANSIQGNDQIKVTLAPTTNAPNGAIKRYSIVGSFDGEGFSLDDSGKRNSNTPVLKLNTASLNQGGYAPTPFPQDAYKAAMAKGFAEGKGLAYADAVRTEWEMGLLEGKKANNGAQNADIADVVTDAALAWAEAEHGVKQTDGNHPVVRRADIITKTPTRYGTDPVTFVVQIQPKWGK